MEYGPPFEDRRGKLTVDMSRQSDRNSIVVRRRSSVVRRRCRCRCKCERIDFRQRSRTFKISEFGKPGMRQNSGVVWVRRPRSALAQSGTAPSPATHAHPPTERVASSQIRDVAMYPGPRLAGSLLENLLLVVADRSRCAKVSWLVNSGRSLVMHPAAKLFAGAAQARFGRIACTAMQRAAHPRQTRPTTRRRRSTLCAAKGSFLAARFGGSASAGASAWRYRGDDGFVLAVRSAPDLQALDAGRACRVA